MCFPHQSWSLGWLWLILAIEIEVGGKDVFIQLGPDCLAGCNFGLRCLVGGVGCRVLRVADEGEGGVMMVVAGL